MPRPPHPARAHRAALPPVVLAFVLALALGAATPVPAFQPSDLPGSTMGYKPPPPPPECDAECQRQRARIRELEDELRWRRETDGYYTPPTAIPPATTPSSQPDRSKPSWAW